MKLKKSPSFVTTHQKIHTHHGQNSSGSPNYSTIIPRVALISATNWLGNCKTDSPGWQKRWCIWIGLNGSDFENSLF
jgi:hypothetical protein